MMRAVFAAAVAVLIAIGYMGSGATAAPASTGTIADVAKATVIVRDAACPHGTTRVCVKRNAAGQCTQWKLTCK